MDAFPASSSATSTTSTSPTRSFDAIYALESIGYTKDLDAWLARCWRMLRPGGATADSVSPGSLDSCRREQDYQNVTAFLRELALQFFSAPIYSFFIKLSAGSALSAFRYRQLPFPGPGA